MIVYKQRNSYDKNRSANSCNMYEFCLFVVRDLHVSQGRHGVHVDHVKDLAEAIHHAQVVKNPDLVLFGKFKQRNSYSNSYYDENRSANWNMSEFCFVCSSRPSQSTQCRSSSSSRPCPPWQDQGKVDRVRKRYVFVIMYEQRNSYYNYDENRSANSRRICTICLISVLFVVGGLNVDEGCHGGHVDHVVHITEVLHIVKKSGFGKIL